MSWGIVIAATVLSLAGGYHYGLWWKRRTDLRLRNIAVACFSLSLALLVTFWVTVWT